LLKIASKCAKGHIYAEHLIQALQTLAVRPKVTLSSLTACLHDAIGRAIDRWTTLVMGDRAAGGDRVWRGG